MPELLLIDDDRAFLNLAKHKLSPLGYSLTEAESGQEGLNRLRRQLPHLILLDYRMPGHDGLTFLKYLQLEPKQPPVFLLSGYADQRVGRMALELGAVDHLPKPIEDRDWQQLDSRIRTTLRHVQGMEDPRNVAEIEACPVLIGESEVMQHVRRQIMHACARAEPVLILGETGTGKEVAARQIIYHSNLKDKPLLKILCPGLVVGLAESELFGHVRGAFSGADRPRTGLFTAADGGAVLLDELGDLSPDIQAKLLQVLESGVVRPVGSNEVTQVDVRVLACTNRDLNAAMRDGAFREDLYYRLSDIVIEMPPLRERGLDIVLLAQHFLDEASEEERRAPIQIDDSAAKRLQKHHWPGNVRELRQVIRQAASKYGQGRAITAKDLNLRSSVCRVQNTSPKSESRDADEIVQELIDMKVAADETDARALLDFCEKNLFESLIKMHGRNCTELAKLVGRSRDYVFKKLKQFGL